MARIVPADLDAARSSGRHLKELDTLERLREGLPDDVTVYHGVHWARVAHSRTAFGEIDFLLVGSDGRIVAIEQKNGMLEVSPDGLSVRYDGKSKSVATQVVRNLSNLRDAFADRFRRGGRLEVDAVLYCPDWRITGPLPASIDEERVIDAAKDASLCALLRKWLTQPRTHRNAPATLAASERPAAPDDVHAFLSDVVALTPDMSALSREAERLHARLSGGMTTWVSRLRLSPHRLRVVGTAGSGKTQLALQELHAAKEAGSRALYMCFNRPLADTMRAAAPEPDSCLTFHELAAKLETLAGEPPDWNDPAVFDRLSERFVERVETDASLQGCMDVLVIDEGQDFRPSWAHALLRLVSPAGRVTWLEDPMQNLYGREPVALPGWAELHAPANHRSPRVVVDLIERLRLCDVPLEAASGVGGFDPQMLSYSGNAVLATEQAIRALRADGHRPDRIAVISLKGVERSDLLKCELIDGLLVRRQVGFTPDGQAIWSAGVVTIDTVFRFKGRAADAVVVTEIDFEEWSEAVRRRLFVALTRARLAVTLVASERAAAAISERLSRH